MSQTLMVLIVSITCHIAKHKVISKEWVSRRRQRECRGLKFLRGQERGATVPVSRPGALLRHPQESNPEVIREVSVGRSEKRRSLSDEAVGALHAHGAQIRVKQRKKERSRKCWRREERRTKNRTPSDFSCFFSVSFRRHINRKKRQEDASECNEEDVNSKRAEEEEDEEEERERQKRGVVDGGWGSKKDEKWRSATGRQNLLDRREALQMWNETRRHHHRQKNTTTEHTEVLI